MSYRSDLPITRDSHSFVRALRRFVGAAPLGAGAILLSMALTVGCASVPGQIARAEKKIEEGDLAGAERQLDAVFENDPSQWKALYLRAQVRMQQGRYQDAQYLLERSVALRYRHEETADIHDLMAESIYRQRDHDALRAMLRQAADRYATQRDFLREGKYLSLIGDPDGAELAYAKAVAVSEDTRYTPYARKTAEPAVPYIKQANFYESIGRRDNAVISLRKAYYFAPDDLTLQKRLRAYGVVPGPAAALKPEREVQVKKQPFGLSD